MERQQWNETKWGKKKKEKSLIIILYSHCLLLEGLHASLSALVAFPKFLTRLGVKAVKLYVHESGFGRHAQAEKMHRQTLMLTIKEMSFAEDRMSSVVGGILNKDFNGNK